MKKVRRDIGRRARRVLRGAALAAVVAAVAVAGAQASWFAEVRGGMQYDDNVSNGALDRDRRSDLHVSAGGDGGWTWPLTENGRLRVRGALAYHAYNDWDKLTNGRFGVDASWRQKVRFGADAPWFDFSLGGRLEEYDSAVRSATVLEGAVRFGHPVSERWSYVVGAEYASRDADTEAFTQDALRIAFVADVFLPGEVTLFAGAHLRSGEFTSTATDPAVDPRTVPLLDASTALIGDDAFPGRIAYRLEGNTLGAEVGVRRAWGGHGFEAAVEYRRTEADAGDVPSYPNNRIRAGYAYTF